MASLRQHVLFLCLISTLVCTFETRDFQCFPYMSTCARDMIIEQWSLARTEIGKPKLCIRQQSTVGEAGNLQFIKFLAIDHTYVHCTYTRSNATMCYSHILKVGSEAINHNLQHHFTKSERSESIKSASEMERFQAGLEPIHKGVNSAYMETFSFVRDPLAHFYSGMAEIVERTRIYGESFNYTLDKINSFTMEEYLDSIIDATQTPHQSFSKDHPQHLPVLFQLAHLRFLANNFFVFNITIIKHLENYVSDWESIHNRFELDFQFDFKQGLHASTAVHHPSNPNKKDDNMHIHSRMDALFATTPGYLRAVCRLLMLDYVCFEEYTLPTACSSMNKTVVALRKQLAMCKKSDHSNQQPIVCKKSETAV